MNLFFSLFILCLSLKFVLSEPCSEALHDAFKKGFNLNEKCEDCSILNGEVSFQDQNWTGFCFKGDFNFFPGWRCKRHDEVIDDVDYFARIVSGGICKICNGKSDNLNENCLKEYNSAECRRNLENLAIGYLTEVTKDSSLLEISEDCEPKRRENEIPNTKNYPSDKSDFSLSNITAGWVQSFEKNPITVDVSHVRTSSSTTEKTTTESTSTEETTTSTTSSTSTENSVTTSTTATTLKVRTTTASKQETEPEETDFCEKGEFFFEDHCYILKFFDENLLEFQRRRKTYKEIGRELTENCRKYHPEALGLAVETERENDFIKLKLKACSNLRNPKSSVFDDFIILTSGVRLNPDLDKWIGWNFTINKTILKPEDDKNGVFFSFNACKGVWYLYQPQNTTRLTVFYIVCERLYNPKNIQLELHKRCLQFYRHSKCYNATSHSNYCCAKDSNGELWFGCPGEFVKKVYTNQMTCIWYCKDDGIFMPNRPKCVGVHNCEAVYNRISYIAPPTKYAIGDCPKHLFGHTTWYCNRNKLFTGVPDYSLCCERPTCRGMDSFLNVWMACPLKTQSQKTTCPPGSRLNEAFVDWYCKEDGTFDENGPDYSRCNVSKGCQKTDGFDREWTAELGQTAVKNCPLLFNGNCYWKCETSGVFESEEPDCSKCRAPWMDEVAEKIKNGTKHEEVMEMMESYTKKQDLKIGYGHVLNLTSDFVTLFKKQNPGDQISVFDNFMKGYSRILKNIASDPKTWSCFTAINRRDFANQILNTTQTASFANLETEKKSSEVYNATLANYTTDGFDFFIAYNRSLKGCRFPLQNFSKSDWQLEVKEVQQDGSNFAAMGLVMNYSLSSLMFPSGNNTEELKMNAPVVTFTVASSSQKEAVVHSNVVVDISFKHVQSTRFPTTQIIRRKLHKGESPSGVFNSTLCYYYRDSDWSPDGCSVTFTSKERTDCRCNHLSSIGLLMSVHKYERDRVLELISIVCSSVTIVSLILALLVFFFFDKVKNERSLIGKNLCFCLLLGHILVLSAMDKRFFYISDELCKIVAIFLHYIFTAAFAWMFVEGCHLYRMLVVVFNSNIEYRYIYMLIGYGVPFLIVGATELAGISFQEQPYGQDELCWLKAPNYIWAFIGPVIVSTSINFIIMIIAMKLAISSKMKTEKSNFVNIKIWIKGWISLSTLLGITWLFGLAYIHYNKVFIYSFCVFNGLQGFFIFLFRCLLSDQYQSCIWKRIKSWCSKPQSDDYKRSENGKSETKLYQISGSKSSSDKPDSGYTTPIQSGSGKQIRKDNETDQYSSSRTRNQRKNKKKASEEEDNSEITLKPALSEAYLRNKLIEKSLSSRKSPNRQTGRELGMDWWKDSRDFPNF